MAKGFLPVNAGEMRALGWEPEVGLEEAYRRLIGSMKEQGFIN